MEMARGGSGAPKLIGKALPVLGALNLRAAFWNTKRAVLKSIPQTNSGTGDATKEKA
jgi:hypothetical protein